MVALLMFSVSSLACDEECRKQAAATKHKVKFASYLSTQYCKDIKSEFLTSAIVSLQRYRDTRLTDSRNYGMKNTRQFIEQRKNWLQECDNYLSLSEGMSLFHEKESSENIFVAMEKVSAELDSLLRGVTYSNASEPGTSSVIADKFDHLFTLVDNHRTLMQLRGQLISKR